MTMADGSSPHARGTHPPGQGREAARRFIPACAGNADPGPSGMDQPPVHPRMRGERQGEIGGFPFVAGSSPHARGTPDRIRARPGGLRFIPACAGNAREHAPLSQHVAVHPRMRGERVAWGAILVVRAGSSPHARGTHINRRHPKDGCRFIPACAGNARGLTCVALRLPVHPRMRGERSRSASCPRSTRGSSPHARGTLSFHSSNPVEGRFIPACAGNASACSTYASLKPVHPRMRGERP